MALQTSVMLVLGGGFFAFTNLALPAIRHIGVLQSRTGVDINSVALAEPESDKRALPEIRRENELLKESISRKLATFPDTQKWSVYMYDLNGGGTVNINSGKAMAAGSVYKLFLLEALESKLPYDKWQYTWMDDGKNISDCVFEMLRSSDSACAEGLGDYIGWNYIDGINHRDGFKDTRMTKDEGRETTVADAGELLIRLKKGQILSDNARRFVFDAMYQQINLKGIMAGCGNCRAADKIGIMDDVANDVGIVTHGGHSYVLAVMSQGGNLKQIAELTRFIEAQRNP
ncbi:MAG TPA: serine hydrolase [Candidatus Saccharimonadales bacterium]|nr:serine hydrolase [Candidatus Saccharimonadales bacterium]